jgi:uncharacterized cupin superfamily protein
MAPNRGLRLPGEHGGRIELAPGVLGVLHDDDVTPWEITEPLRKVWIVASPSGE